jgi:dihydrofolate reductase
MRRSRRRWRCNHALFIRLHVKINLIWAQARDTHGRPVIGKDGAMPWHLPEDLAHFKKTTLGCPVIMGRKTWDSLPAKFRPLPGRLNVVISSQAATREILRKSGASPGENLTNSLFICEQSGAAEVWVIGGAQIYAQALPLAHQLVVTEIDAPFEGDAFAPALDAQWQEMQRESHAAASGLRYSFVTYQRRP